MARSSKMRRIGAAVALTLVAGLVLMAANVGRIVDYAMAPGVAFDAETPPAAPDYRDAASWSALPERDDLADRAPAGEAAMDPSRAAADVFFIHSTSYVGSRWNGPTDDASLNQATDRVGTGIQASAFSGCCAVYAPRYRQANGTAFHRPSADGERAIDLAYQDVLRAFEAFDARRGAERPFILAAHSQGSVLGERLLYEAIAATPRRARLVAAYLIGGGATVAGLAERALDVAPCRTPRDVGCVVAWNARSKGYQPGEYELVRPDTRERLCVNPLSWAADGEPAPASANLGAVFLETDDHAPRAGFADATCARGVLVVSHMGDAPRDLPSRILDHVMGEGNYHPIEYQAYFMNLRRNAEERVAAFLSR
jgi:hypothetical protein